MFRLLMTVGLITLPFLATAFTATSLMDTRGRSSMALYEQSPLLDKASQNSEVTRRIALVTSAAMVAMGGSMEAAEAATLASKVSLIETKNLAEANTKGAPEKHIPKVTVDGSSVQVVVPHVMDAEKPHYIEYVWLTDSSTNKIVSAIAFKATDASPPTLTSSVKKGTTVIPRLFCNLHGLWEGEPVTGA